MNGDKIRPIGPDRIDVPWRQEKKKPVRKVSYASAVAGAITVLVWVLSTFIGLDVPPEVAAGLTTILVFVVGYFTRPAPSDQIAPDPKEEISTGESP